MDAIEQRTMAKVTRRLVPFLILCYFVAYLDRVNVGFAGLTMRDDLGLSASAFGLGSGIFFIAYFFFEVPSNLLLHRFGASRWIARIMLTWGLISGATAFIGGETGFYALRVLLGIAEAGFFPGIIFFLTLWFPSVYRGRIVGWFMAAIPASSVIGAPVSSMLLYLDGVAGFKGWQWMFIVEALPAVILSVVVFFYLTDRPDKAGWLAGDERKWLVARLAAEQKLREANAGRSLGQTLLNQPGLTLLVVAVAAGLSAYVSSLAGPWALPPYAAACVAMVLFGRAAERADEGPTLTLVRAGVAVAVVLLAGAVQTNVIQGVFLQALDSKP
jgi:MFS family permease